MRLLHLTEIDEQDDLEQVWLLDFKELEQLLIDSGDDDQKIQYQLHEKCQSKQGQDRISNALLVGILCDRSKAQNYFRYLTLIVKDQFQFCCKQLTKLVTEKYPRMNDRAAQQASPQQSQLIWLIRELIALNVQGVDKVFIALLRQIIGGNMSPTNRWLVNSSLRTLLDYKSWLYEQPNLIPLAFYTFCRLAADHSDPKYEKLRKQEATLCCDLWRDKFQECKVIGRDAVRILQDVARIPEFEALWEDMLGNPKQFGGMADISELLTIKTPCDILKSRLTPEMESQLVFIMMYVKMGQQQRYQKWFMQRWGLSTPDGEPLIVDLVRFICCCFHPPNEIIRSEVVQRWAALGWLLKCAKSPPVLANIKLAIFYDWLFFVPKHDSVMNVEPAALLITRSIPKWLDITVNLMEFVLAAADEWSHSYTHRCRRGLFNAANECVKLGVIRSWGLVSACAQINPALRARIRAQFNGLCRDDPEVAAQEDIQAFSFDPQLASSNTLCSQSPSTASQVKREGISPAASPRASSSSEDIWSNSPGASKTGDWEESVSEVDSTSDTDDTVVGSRDGNSSPSGTPSRVEHLDSDVEFSGPLRDLSAKLKALRTAAEKHQRDQIGNAVQDIVRGLAGKDFDKAAQKSLAEHLLRVIGDEIQNPTGNQTNGGLLARSESTAFHVLSALNELFSEKQYQDTVGDLCHQMQTQSARTSVLLLEATPSIENGSSEQSLHLYRRVLEAEAQESQSEDQLESLVLRDLREAFADDLHVFVVALSAASKVFPAEIPGNAQVLQLVCGSLTPSSLCSLCSSLSLGEAELICKHSALLDGEEGAEDRVQSLFARSLAWEVQDQQVLWQLFTAEFSCLPHALELVLPKLLELCQSGGHPEVVHGLVNLLSLYSPTADLLAPLVSLPASLWRDICFCVISRWSTANQQAWTALVVRALNEGDSIFASSSVGAFMELLHAWGQMPNWRTSLWNLVNNPEVAAALQTQEGPAAENLLSVKGEVAGARAKRIASDSGSVGTRSSKRAKTEA